MAPSLSVSKSAAFFPHVKTALLTVVAQSFRKKAN